MSVIERAAKALAETVQDDPRDAHFYCDHVRAAILAALDMTDDAMMDAVGDAICDEFERCMKEQGAWAGVYLAAAAISALRSLAQETVYTQTDAD